jgi:hypothetical protein
MEQSFEGQMIEKEKTVEKNIHAKAQRDLVVSMMTDKVRTRRDLYLVNMMTDKVRTRRDLIVNMMTDKVRTRRDLIVNMMTEKVRSCDDFHTI